MCVCACVRWFASLSQCLLYVFVCKYFCERSHVLACAFACAEGFYQCGHSCVDICVDLARSPVIRMAMMDVRQEQNAKFSWFDIPYVMTLP